MSNDDCDDSNLTFTEFISITSELLVCRQANLQCNIQGGFVERTPSALSSLPFLSSSFGEFTDNDCFASQGKLFFLFIHLPQSIYEL